MRARILSGLLLCGLAVNIFAAGQRKPNVVVFLVDDMGADEIACYASKFHETPNIDALAKRGMLFTQAHAAAALCSPSRAAIMTGC